MVRKLIVYIFSGNKILQIYDQKGKIETPESFCDKIIIPLFLKCHL